MKRKVNKDVKPRSVKLTYEFIVWIISTFHHRCKAIVRAVCVALGQWHHQTIHGPAINAPCWNTGVRYRYSLWINKWWSRLSANQIARLLISSVPNPCIVHQRHYTLPWVRDRSHAALPVCLQHVQVHNQSNCDGLSLPPCWECPPPPPPPPPPSHCARAVLNYLRSKYFHFIG